MAEKQKQNEELDLEQIRTAMEEIISRAKGDGRDLTEDESKDFDALESRADELTSEQERAAKADEETRTEAEKALTERSQRVEAIKARMITPRVRVGKEEATYRRDGSHSFFVDLFQAGRGDTRSVERIQRNNAERMKDRAISTTFGAAGEFVPPLWLEEDFVKIARPGRPFANVWQNLPLPAGTDSINIPKLSTGTAVATQAAQNTAVQQTDITSTSISAPVSTIAGGQTVSMQLVEQSPLSVDRIVLQDLAAAYAVSLDSALISDSTNGVGAVGTAVAVTGTATGASAAAAIYAAVSKSIGTFITTRYATPTHIVMHPRRWYWLLGISDSSNRPLVVPSPVAFNPVAQTDGVTNEGIVGQMVGLPVLLDASIPTNLGASTNQDEIFIVRADDLMLFEGSVRAEAFPQTYANQLSLFVRLYNYVAFTAKRYNSAIQVIGGTQLNVLS